MKLIIAEKPSLAKNIVFAINPKMKKSGSYFEDNEYIVTWAFGHLFSLEDIEHYNPSQSKYWSMENIPCFPEKFDFSLKKGKDGKIDGGIKKQFDTITYLCNRNDVDTIINAGDADREGEIIVRLCVQNALKTQKKLLRLWLTDQTPETIKKALASMEDELKYDSLASEGFARTYIDWLYGVNLTRYATLRSGTLLRVGRVIVPIVRAIYDRDMAIRNFVPEKYYIASSKEKTNDEVVELNGKDKFSKDNLNKCADLCKLYNQTGAVVKSVKHKKTVIPPGKLFSLSTLQNLLGKKYKMSMGDSLNIIQGLYEKGYLTYPRTNSEYLTENEKGRVKSIISICVSMGYSMVFKDKKTIFDDSKVESHTALTPTSKIPKKDQLTEDEFKVYSTVFRRFAAVFCKDDCVADKAEMVIEIGNYESFTLKGTVILEKGWTQYDDYTRKDKMLPKLNEGDAVNINFVPTEKETTPPQHYTIETLNNYLKNPFRDKKAEAKDGAPENDDDEYKAIFEGLELGTEATRTGIIDNARNSKYILLTKDVYTILPGGEYLINTLEMLSISMDKYKTAEVGKALKKVFHGDMSVSDSVSLAENEIKNIFNASETTEIGFANEEVGVCPICSSVVKRTPRSYSCSNRECEFVIWLRICDKTITVSEAKQLLTNGKTDLLSGFKSKKSGKNFDAVLKFDENKKVVFDFGK